MAFHVLGDLFVLVHSRQPPSDEEWNAYLDALRQRSARIDWIRTLIYTEGGGPLPAQRKSLNDVLKGRTTRVAVMSDASLVRMIATALGWFNPAIRAFSPQDRDEALNYLGIPEAEAAFVWSEIYAMLRTLAAAKADAATVGMSGGEVVPR